MSKKSYVERSLKWLRVRNITYSVSSWYGVDRRRHDLLGVFDYVGFATKRTEAKLIGIQICGKDFLPHVRKIESSHLAKLWVRSKNDILLIGWRELKSGWKARTKMWLGGDLTSFQTNPIIPKSSKHLKLPDISLL